MNIAQENIDLLVKAVAESAHPLRIILFGSAAKERNTSESDIDLLVIMPNGVHRRKTAQAIYRTVRNVGVPYDIIVATPDDIERHKNNTALIYHTALSDGKEVYVK